MKKILFIVDCLALGGLAKVILTLSKELKEQGHTIGLAILENNIEYSEASGYWTRVNRDPPPKNTLSKKRYRNRVAIFAQKSEKEFEDHFGKADLIIAAGELAIRCTANLSHPNIVISSHSSQLQAKKLPGILGELKLKIRITRRSIRLKKLLNNRKLHFVSHGLMNEITKTLKVKPLSAKVIYNPFETKEIIEKSKEATIESSNLPERFIIGIGGFCKRKRFDRLILAYKQANITADLILIGQGEEEENIKKLISTLHLEKNVHLIPFHNNHYAILKKASLLVLSSDSEGLPNVINEALILDVPVVSTDCPHGPKELLEDIQPNALVPLESLQELAQKIKFYYENPYPIPDWAKARVDIKTIVAQYLEMS
ncbi:glycosyltransferase [Laribacter hongkongensis]|uniref:glycosyltransferase n=1 Tax=Laribacter hongkongensis TaxID=168471 RepID=UPI001EFDA373|nr:glycosyltransferase [Laribacter hongkongensis]MCG8995736.1 glycosyltransferase [Laribacter hongkongensis]MCG9009891.1 glycosyltransferase [Laribacter hongkongensis]MCG9023485.1 glycosyltransferase [Laribacter hongkongensis]MCG9047283.1 glycosyltransferase [Laribacter hongkongensis]